MTDDDRPGADENGARPAPWHIRALMVFAATMMCAMMTLTFVDVVGRYVFDSPIPGGFEYIEFLLALTIFSALPLITRDREHITVSLLDHFFRGRVRWLQQFFVLIVSVVMVGFIAERMWSQGEYLRETDRAGEYLDLPLWPIVHGVTFLSVVAFLLLLGVIWKFLTSDQVTRQ